MTWLALLSSASIIAIEWRSLRTASRRERTLYTLFVSAALLMAVSFDTHLLTGVHVLAPVDALFRPATEWLYQVL
ncbi:hypothetical protein C7445_11268 [Alicyclobacillus sacchari]|uniref:Uncharacterized protein n=1 Tax=Alicyclobacillus sacchari TaxID=392010 RepID=A0A4R8LKZ1_9BACL|nr:hypothetical protein [Alicyclobacillus sacchari]TDY43083.1 hypothetical protein C7445_11268 [Alicyclobacillus sacchari]